MMRTVAVWIACAALLSLGGCVSDQFCTTELRAAVHGYVIAPDGQTVVPDAMVSIKGGREEPCEVWEDGSYACWERGGGEYELRVFVGEQRWTWWVDVDDDGCHVEPVMMDLVLNTP